MLYTAALFGTLWGFAYTSARPSSAYVVVKQIGYPHGTDLLVARQSDNPDVPSQCKSTCDPPNTAIANNCTPQKCCTATFETQYYNCLVCVGSALKVTDYSSAQAVLNALEQQCAAHGLGIPTLTLPGQEISSPTRPATSTSTRVTPASTTSARSPVTSSEVSSRSWMSTELRTLPVPPSPIVQHTVTVDTRTTAPAFTSITAPASTSTAALTSTSSAAADGNGAPTMKVHVSLVWATILTFVIVAIGYL